MATPDRVLQARLVVAADGIDSAVRKAFGVGVETRDYEQAAIITTVLPASFTSTWPTNASPPRGRLRCCRSPTAAAPWS